VVGPSGCGKTTLLKIVAGLLRPTDGRVEFGIEHEWWTPENGRAWPRNALVFQEHGVFPWMTVADNVAFGLEMRGVARRERRGRARAFLDRVGLGAFADNYPSELSVGMRQRVGIARAFVTDVPILLMDEPFGSLDAQTKLLLQEELLRIWREDRKLVVFVTHDLEEAVRMGDRVLVMTGRPGRIREEIPVTVPRPRSGVRDPRHVAEIAWHIWQLLRDEVRKSFSGPS
jgi:NitT/TauT family transport system ATP-binding protein